MTEINCQHRTKQKIVKHRRFARTKFAFLRQKSIYTMQFYQNTNMVKKLLILIMIITSASIARWLNIPNIDDTILNTNENDAVNTDLTDGNPIRDGIYNLIQDSQDQNNVIANIIGNGAEIGDHTSAQNQTFQIINNFINYALWLVAMIALIYLLYHGFLMITAAGDEEQYGKWLQWIKYAGIALAGIGVSRFVVSLIFYLIQLITA